jgi:RNA polymerase sigma factor (sigma-70 family)
MAQDYVISGQANEEVVYRQYANQVYTYLLRHVPSQQDAEDLLLDVFLAVLEKLPALSIDERRLAAYIQTVAHNKMVDYYRQRGHHQLIPLDEAAETTYEPEELAPEQLALTREQYAKLHLAVSALPELQQTILLLRFGHNLRCSEIATRLSKSEGAVRMMLSRTLRFLRSISPIYEER